MRVSKFTRAVLPIFLVLVLISSASSQTIPKPEDIIGFKPGADFHLATYKQAIEYFNALEKSTSRMKIFSMGETAMGQDMIYMVISSEDNMRNLDRYREISARLAVAEGLTDDEARLLAEEGKAVVYIDGGLHASEVAHAQQIIQLAYDMVASEERDIQKIRDEVILLLVIANPDGMNMVPEWYMKYVGTKYERSGMPWLYHYYAGHDNNRDGFMLNLPETRNIIKLTYREWYPQIFYNHHQSSPFPTRILMPPMAEPTNPDVHPLQIRWQNLLGSWVASRFERENKPGVISHIGFDSWYPGYLDAVGDSHNLISFMTETASSGGATPRFYTLNDFSAQYQDFTISHFYTNPWEGGWWRLGDAVEYMLTSSKGVMEAASIHKEQLLYDRYFMGKEVIERFKNESPYAWIIPQKQNDVPTAAHLLNNMYKLGIEIYQADEEFESEFKTYPKGTWVIPMDQAFSLFVKSMFEEQKYLDLRKYPFAWQGIARGREFDIPFLGSHDVYGWTLPYQMGVDFASAGKPLEVSLTHLETIEPPAGTVSTRTNGGYLISPKVNKSFNVINRILADGGEVSRARTSFSDGGKTYPAGTWIVAQRSVSRSIVENAAKEFGLQIDGANSRINVPTFSVKIPKVGLYKSWQASMDEGWTRLLFEQHEIPFKNIQDSEIKAGSLNRNFDTIVFPSMSNNQIINGRREGTIPPEYAGGITQDGVRNIKEFVEEGGTLVLLNGSYSFAIDELELPIKNVLSRFGGRGGRGGGGRGRGAAGGRGSGGGRGTGVIDEPTHDPLG